MINTPQRIVWQKWQDPYDLEDEQDFDPKQDLLEEEYDGDDDTPNQFMQQQFGHAKFLKKPIKLIMTPMGAIPIHENSSPGKIFNFWMAHTNFNITNEISNIVETTEGVETLDIFTRYRMRIGFGQAFDDCAVRRQIDKNLSLYLQPQKKIKKEKNPSKTFNLHNKNHNP